MRDRWHIGSFVRGLWRSLDRIDFLDEAMLFGGGLLTSLIPLLVLMSAFANQRIDDDLAFHLGLDHRATTIVSHLFTQASPAVNVATVTSLVFVIAGTLAVASSLQQVYETVFDQPHRGLRDLPRLVAWMVALGGVLVLLSLAGKPLRSLPGGPAIVAAVMVAVLTPFLWWTMHFLLAGNVSWRRLWPSAVATGILYAGLGLFSKVYFSSSIISDDRTFGAIGAVFSITTWLIAIGAMLLLGAVAGPVWEDRAREASG
jgi:membrane protein